MECIEREKGELSDDITNNFLASLNDPSIYYTVIIVLSQLRTNNKLNKSIGKIVHVISLQLQLYERNVKELIKLNEIDR